MANDKDLFAPPTEEELYAAPTSAELEEPVEDDLFAVPTDDELFAAPSDEELDKVEPSEPEEMSKLEAAAMGAGSAAFGLAPILSGVAAAGMEAAEDVGDVLGLTTSAELEREGFKVEDEHKGLGGLLEAYYKGREKHKEFEEKAAEDQPWTYYPAMLASGIPGMQAAGAAAKGISKLGKAGEIAAKALPALEKTKGMKGGQIAREAMKEGAKAGALAGFGTGEAELLRGDVEETLKETGATALGGATLAGGLTGAGLAAKEVAKLLPGFKTAQAGYKYGLKGRHLDEESILQDTQRTANIIRHRFNKLGEKYKLEKKNIEDLANDIGLRINAGETLDEAFNEAMDVALNKATSQKKYDQIKGFADLIDEFRGNPKEAKKFIEATKKEIIKKGLKDVKGEAAKKLEKQALQRAIKTGEKPSETAQFKHAAEDVFEEGPKTAEALERVDLVQQAGKGDTSELIERKLTADITPFKPTPIKTSFDPDSNRFITQYKDEATGKIMSKVGAPGYAPKDATKLTLEQVDDMIETLHELGEEGTSKAVQKMAGAYAGKLRNLQNQTLEVAGDKAKVNEAFRRLSEAMDRAGVPWGKKYKGDTEAVIRQQKNKIEELMFGDSSKNKRQIQDIHDVLKKVDEPTAERVKKLLDEYQQLHNIATKESAEQSVSIRSAIGSAQNLLAKAANIAGLAKKGAVKGAKKPIRSLHKGYKAFLEKSPEDIATLAGEFEKAGSQYTKQLKRLAEESPMRRHSIMYGLYQQPAFRQELQKIGEGVADLLPDIDSE